jgi:hypothetical protein
MYLRKIDTVIIWIVLKVFQYLVLISHQIWFPRYLGLQENKQTLVFKNICWLFMWKSWLKLSCFLWFQIIFNNNHLKSVRYLGNHIWCEIRTRYWVVSDWLNYTESTKKKVSFWTKVLKELSLDDQTCLSEIQTMIVVIGNNSQPLIIILGILVVDQYFIYFRFNASFCTFISHPSNTTFLLTR